MLYKHVTDERISSWQDGGQQHLISEADIAYAQNDPLQMCTIMHELVRSALDSRLGSEQAGQTVNMIIEHASEGSVIDAAEAFLDTLSTVPGADLRNPNLKPLCFATQIPADTMRLVLETDMLIALGLVRETFNRMFIRKQTNILYKQSNYNLLREETEGYSKLITELFAVSQDPDPTAAVAQETFENMKALIGAFDLDAGRVLDVTLDVCAGLLVKNPRFFVKLLRISDYWPQETSIDGVSIVQPDIRALPLWAAPDHDDWRLSDEEYGCMVEAKTQRDERVWKDAKDNGIRSFYSLGGRRVFASEERMEELRTASESPVDAKVKDQYQWISRTGTLPPAGSPVAAQLLGFKLRFYASTYRSKGESMPSALIYLTAMLIKIGFISLLDIYPHLSPADDNMDAIKERGMQERAEREHAKRGGASMNALSRAGALADDTAPAPVSRLRNPTDRAVTPTKADMKNEAIPRKKEESTDTEQQDETPDQKISLLKSLLCIGALPESLHILGRFPWLLDTVPDLPKHIFRILHHCLSTVYRYTLPHEQSFDLQAPGQVPTEDQSAIQKGGISLTDVPPAKTLKWGQLDTIDTTEDVEYRFYWEEWADSIPVCQDVNDVFTLCDTLISLVGVKIGQDAFLLTKLARIGNYSLDNDTSQSNRDRWQDLLKRLLCPALSMTRANTSVVGEVFSLLKRYPIHIRYNIYAEWFTGATARQMDVSDAFNLTRYETKDIMKKVNKLDSSPSARKLAKACSSAPGIVFEVFLKQLEQYDNLIDVVVDCGHHFTELSYDVLTWSILTFLGNEGRSRISQTGFTANKWLVSLSSFTGKILRKYSAMSVQPFILYILSQLQKNSYIDIRVLRDIIQQMSGVTALTDLTDAQMMAMAGGELLRTMTLHQLQDRRNESSRAARRLMSSLIDNNRGSALLLSLAQQREMCVFNHDRDDNKILSEVYDELNTVFRQFLDMIQANTTQEQFDTMVPDLIALISDYGLEARTAFTIQRASIAVAMAEYDAKHAVNRRETRTLSIEKPQSPDVSVTNDTVIVDDIERKADATEAVETVIEEPSDVVQLSNGDVSTTEGFQTVPEPTSCHPILQDLTNRIRPVVGVEFEAKMNLAFYVTFWQLSLSDLLAPTNIYEDEMKKTLAKKAAIVPDRSDASMANARRREAEKKAIDDAHDKLMKEMKTQMKHFQVVQSRLTKEKDQWFKDFHGKWDALNFSLLQECFLPRLVLSPLDSFYAQKMLFFLHGKGTRNFRTMHFFDRLFDAQTVTNLVFSCSSKEAENFGKFLAEVLKTLNEWHADRREYEKKALGSHNTHGRVLPGFAKRINDEGQPESFLDFEDYRALLYKWHRKLQDGLKKCLEQYEYTYVKNAITIITAIAPHYPVIKTMGQDFLQKLQQLRDREQPAGEGEKSKPLARQDLWTSANSAQAPLKRRERHWILVQEFYVAKGKSAAPAAINTKIPETSKIERPKALDGNAPDFIPRHSNATNGIPMSAVSVEDGELKDTPMTDAPKVSIPDAKPKPAPTETQQPETTRQSESGARPPPTAAGNSMETSNSPETMPTKHQESTSRPQSSGASAREDERILKQRAMESMKRRPGSEMHKGSRASEAKDEKPVQSEPQSSKPPTPQSSRPPSRNLASEQTPDAPRRDRERPSRYGSYDNHEPYRQMDSVQPPAPPRSNNERMSSRYNTESDRISRHSSDMSYGRLNAQSDQAQHSSSRPAPRGPPSGPQALYQDRRQSDGLGAMGPPPRRDHVAPASARPQFETSRVTEQRPNGTSIVTSERASGMNPERAARLEQRSDYASESRSSRIEPPLASEPVRPPPELPPSPRGPRYGQDAGASIRGQASFSTPPNQGTSQQSPRGPPPSSAASGVHPSRMGQIEGTNRLPPIQTNADLIRRPPQATGYPSSPAGPPSGPRSAGPPSAVSPTSYALTTGPSGITAGRREGTGPQRQFSQMQEALNQSGQPPRPPPNGMVPRGGPASAPPPPPPRALRSGYHSDASPPSSRGYDTRASPVDQYTSESNGPLQMGRGRNPPLPLGDLRGPPPAPPAALRSEVAIPPSDAPTAYDRDLDRGPRREPRELRGEREQRGPYPPKDYRESRDQRSERSQLDFRNQQSDRSGAAPPNFREPRADRPGPDFREQRPDLMSRDSGTRRPRELMPEGPSNGRDSRDAQRLRETDRMRERSPRLDGRPRELREPRNYPNEYRDRREDPRGGRDFNSAGSVRRNDRANAPMGQEWRVGDDRRKRDFEGYDEDKRALRGRDIGARNRGGGDGGGRR